MPSKANGAAGTIASSDAGGPSGASGERRAIVWISPAQAALVGEVALRAGLTVVGAGYGRGGLARQAVEALGAAPFDDLRHALRTTDADIALIGATGDATEAAALDDPELLRSCAERRVRLVTLEPAPASLAGLSRPSRAEGLAPVGASPTFAPLFRRSPGLDGAMQAFEAFGQATTLVFGGFGAAGQGALAARVFDAMDFVSSLLGMPESIDAAVRGPRSESGLRLAPGESLRDLRGDMTAHMRFADGRACAVALSDRAGRWAREATLIGEHGRMRIDDGGFEWIDPAGAVADSSRREAKVRKPPNLGASTRLISPGARRLPQMVIHVDVPSATEQLTIRSSEGGVASDQAVDQRLVAQQCRHGE